MTACTGHVQTESSRTATRFILQIGQVPFSASSTSAWVMPSGMRTPTIGQVHEIGGRLMSPRADCAPAWLNAKHSTAAKRARRWRPREKNIAIVFDVSTGGSPGVGLALDQKGPGRPHLIEALSRNHVIPRRKTRLQRGCALLSGVACGARRDLRGIERNR